MKKFIIIDFLIVILFKRNKKCKQKNVTDKNEKRYLSPFDIFKELKISDLNYLAHKLVRVQIFRRYIGHGKYFKSKLIKSIIDNYKYLLRLRIMEFMVVFKTLHVQTKFQLVMFSLKISAI